MISVRTAARVTLAALLLSVVVADPAAAHGRQLWPTVPCATGELTAQPDAAEHPLRARLVGWIQPCPDVLPDPSARFGAMLYADGARQLTPLLAYDTAEARTPFTGRLDLTETVRARQVRAVCLVFGPDGRAACVGIAVDQAGRIVVTSIPTDDERVATLEPIRPGSGGLVPEPHCANCVYTG